jgi:hypothetical protein
LELVRRRANFVCEYCGVSEVDSGARLTLDHYQPTSQEGTDDPNNLIYACFACNVNKGDYWPDKPNSLRLWNPRVERFEQHFVQGPDGELLPRTEIGQFTIHLVRLNRPELLAHRRHGQYTADRERLLRRLRDLIAQAAQSRELQAAVFAERSELLKRLEAVLRMLLDKDA